MRSIYVDKIVAIQGQLAQYILGSANQFLYSFSPPGAGNIKIKFFLDRFYIARLISLVFYTSLKGIYTGDSGWVIILSSNQQVDLPSQLPISKKFSPGLLTYC